MTKNAMSNTEIAELLRDVAASYQIENEAKNKFKIIAYNKAADAIEHASSELKDIWDEGKLEDVPGIGKSISENLGELFKTGKSAHFDELLSKIPKAIFTLMKVPGIGPKTAYKLVSHFKISSKNPIDSLEKKAKSGLIAKLPGFGIQSQAEILRSLEDYKKAPPSRKLLPFALEKSQEVIEWMKKSKSVLQIDSLGSLRRRVSTIGDIDICVATNDPVSAVEHFVSFPGLFRLIEKGEKTASILLPGGVQVDLLIQEPNSYGSALQHFTGSKHHNISLREYSLKKGFSLSENGIKETKTGKLHRFSDEKSFYRFLGLDWIPPELREDIGEIKLAQDKKLPNLVEISDIKSDLQMHSDYNIETSHDIGASSPEDLVKMADKLNYEYIAMTEHNPSQKGHSEKQIIDILKKKREYFDQINYSIFKNKKYSVKKVFNSLEIDILPSGKLPVPEAGLETLDFALVSIHSSFKLDRATQTKRVLTALSYPKVKIFAHPTGRKLNYREGVDLDWDKIFDFCKERNIWIEINADPSRLDLPDNLVRIAVKEGIKLTLGTDAHNDLGLLNMQYGLTVARRGFAQKQDIVNTKTLAEFEKLLDNR